MEVEPSVQKCRVQVSMSCQAYQSVWHGKAGCTCSRTRTLVFEQDRTLYQRVLPPAYQTCKVLGTAMKLVLSLPKCLLLLLFHDGTNPNQIGVFFLWRLFTLLRWHIFQGISILAAQHFALARQRYLQNWFDLSNGLNKTPSKYMNEFSRVPSLR